MTKDKNLKIITLAFLSAAFLGAFIVRLVFETLAAYFGPVALAYGQEWIRHGVPILGGICIFAFLQMKEETRVWANEVVVEVSKVVWPSRPATMGMTTVVCVILMVAGAALGVFDLVGGALVEFIIN